MTQQPNQDIEEPDGTPDVPDEVTAAEWDEQALPEEEDEVDSAEFSDMETPAELLPAAEPLFMRSSSDMPPALDRPRPERQPIVSRKVWIAAIAVVVALALAALAWVLVDLSSRVTVPDVTGQSLSAARTALEQAGLEVEVSERRFSDRPVDEVLEQSPPNGTVVTKGDAVSLVVSAGIEDFEMPDVIGLGVTIARRTLEERGLIVVEEPAPSEAASGTVLSTNPAAGAIVRSGDRVRIQVAAPQSGGPSLRPYRMEGLTVVIDPAPPEEGTPDATLDVARRLRSLLEASGATVVTVRSSDASDTSESARADAAEQAAPTVAVGLAISETGKAGRVVTAPSGSFAVGVVAERLASATVSQLTTVAPPASAAPPSADDPVFAGLSAPWMRVRIGSAADRTDLSSFSDPRWADRVARGIYMGIGEVFGVKEEL